MNIPVMTVYSQDRRGLPMHIHRDISNTLLAVEQLRPYIPSTANEALDTFGDNLVDMILNRRAPSDYFQELSYGSYKEVYHIPGLKDWVIKFYTEENNTEDEIRILRGAIDYGVDQLFVPTIFVEFGAATLPISIIIDENYHSDSRYIYNSATDEFVEQPWPLRPQITGFELQPLIDRTSENDYYLDPKSYEDNPLYRDNHGVPYDYFYLRETNVDSATWLRTVQGTYGDDFFRTFHDFVRCYRICDLHVYNTGYMTNDGELNPVILDWLSY